MRVLLILLGLQLAGLALLLSPLAYAGVTPRGDRALWQVASFAVSVAAAWAILWLEGAHPRAAAVVWRLALVFVTLEAANAVMPF